MYCPQPCVFAGFTLFLPLVCNKCIPKSIHTVDIQSQSKNTRPNSLTLFSLWWSHSTCAAAFFIPKHDTNGFTPNIWLVTFCGLRSSILWVRYDTQKATFLIVCARAECVWWRLENSQQPSTISGPCRGPGQQQGVHQDPATAQHAEETKEAPSHWLFHWWLRGDSRRWDITSVNHFVYFSTHTIQEMCSIRFLHKCLFILNCYCISTFTFHYHTLMHLTL